jgi:SAM-dependent methyltransferase
VPFILNKFGGDCVSKIDVMHYVEGNPDATIVADLTKADHIPSDKYDCIILTQTLQMIYEMKVALRHLHRIIKPGGVLLMTSHGIVSEDIDKKELDYHDPDFEVIVTVRARKLQPSRCTGVVIMAG